MNPRRRFLTGMVAEDASSQRTALLKDQVGFGVLFLSFPGRLESAQEVEKQFEPRYRHGSISVLNLLIHPTVRERLEKYLQEFKEKRGDHSYGLPNRPLFLEGSGCSAFAGSFLEVAGLDLPEFRQNWTQTIRVPLDLIGGASTGKKVSFPKLLAARPKNWATPDQPHLPIFFWDPDLMHQWLVKTWKKVETGERLFIDRPYRSLRRHKALELEIDLSHIEAPKTPIWPA